MLQRRGAINKASSEHSIGPLEALRGLISPPRVKREADAWRRADLLFLAVWACGAVSALAIKHSQLFVGFDGAYIRDLARRQFDWSIPFFTSSIDLFQGVADQFFAGIHFTLVPSFIVGSLFGVTAVAKVATYAVALIEATMATIFFARTVGAGRTEAVAAALLFTITVFPLYGVGAIYGVLSLVPHLATFISAALIISATFLRFGRRGAAKDWYYAAIFLGVGLWFVHAGVLLMVLAGPSLIIAGIAGLLAAGDRREFQAKLAIIAIAGLIFAAPGLYLLGLLLNAAPVTAPIELANDRATLESASILFHWQTYGGTGPVLVVCAVFGALLETFNRSNLLLRLLAITLLTYLFSRITFWIITLFHDFWRGPTALYFEFFVFPIYAIFAVLLFSRLISWVRLRQPWRPSELMMRGACTAAAGAIALYWANTTPSPSYGFAYPPSPTGLTPLLQSQIGITAPAPFRGRVATLTGLNLGQRVEWTDLHILDADLEREFGNEMRLIGLHYFGIPGLFQYGSTMTPAFYTLTTRLFARPQDRQQRSVSVIRGHEPKLYAMLGVSHAVTDAPLADAELLQRVGNAERGLYLYRIPQPNLGDYSPTRVVLAATASESLALMVRPEFEPTREIIAHSPLQATHVAQAEYGRMEFNGTSLRITARSDDVSILLLPLEYSRCLTVKPRSGSPILFRANLLLTGVIFSKFLDAEIGLRNGPFVDPSCRLRDFADLLAMNIQSVPTKVRLPPQQP